MRNRIIIMLSCQMLINQEEKLVEDPALLNPFLEVCIRAVYKALCAYCSRLAHKRKISRLFLLCTLTRVRAVSFSGVCITYLLRS